LERGSAACRGLSQQGFVVIVEDGRRDPPEARERIPAAGMAE
jgi:hypothetical protein